MPPGDACLEDLLGDSILGAADPVERILEQGRDGGVVLGAGDEDAGMGIHHRLELAGVVGHAVRGFQITVVDRQGIVSEIEEGRRDAICFRNHGAQARELLVVGACARGAGKEEQSGRG
jgi:hypothetical protein